jgi:uncharacterized protein (DUF1697 family)
MQAHPPPGTLHHWREQAPAFFIGSLSSLDCADSVCYAALMVKFVALLRAVNVGGTGKLPMAELRAMANRAGFARAATYIASGNLVFEADLAEAAVVARLQDQLAAHFSKSAQVLVRTADEIAKVVADNPFPEAPFNRTVAVFLPHRPEPAMLDGIRHQTTERIGLGLREVYIAYGDTMGRSRLVVPGTEHGTARNMNTAAVLARMASQL